MSYLTLSPKLDKVKELKILVNELGCIRETYMNFDSIMDEMEEYLRKELGLEKIGEPINEEHKVGEHIDFEKALDVMEELFRFLIISKEHKLKDILNN